jgi:hypothetical protein
VAANPPPDLVLSSLTGRSRTVREWVTTFHLLIVAVDPNSPQSRWIVPTAARVLTIYEGADCRVGWLVAGDAKDARRFLGRWATDILTFTDPDLAAIKAFGLETLPAILHLDQELQVVNAVEGWDPMAWRALATQLSHSMSWSKPLLPAPGDPGPFAGAPLPRV